MGTFLFAIHFLFSLGITAAPKAPVAALSWTVTASGEARCLNDDGRGTDYIVSRSDSIRGLDNPRHLTRPAKVNYAKLLAATPEMRQMKKEKVDLSSPKGIQLRMVAAERISKACEKVRSAQNHCSVWKAITRRDGKPISDITSLVKKELGG